MGGDINARLLEWGMPSTNRRGRAVLDMAARFVLQVANQRSIFMYSRPGFGNLILDVSFASKHVAGLIRGWRVSGSEHQHILFELTNREEVRPAVRLVHWSVIKLDRDRLVAILQKAAESLLLPAGTTSHKKVENFFRKRHRKKNFDQPPFFFISKNGGFRHSCDRR